MFLLTWMLFPESATLYKPGFHSFWLATKDTNSNQGTGMKVIAPFHVLGIVLALMTVRGCKCRTCLRTHPEIKSETEVTCTLSHYWISWISSQTTSAFLGLFCVSSVAGWIFSSRCCNGTQTGGRGSPERALGSAGSSHGSPADHTASDYQQIHCRPPAAEHVLQSYAFQVKPNQLHFIEA